jgi:hypothetical protein
MKKHLFSLLSVLILLSLVWMPTFSAEAKSERSTVCTIETDTSKIPGQVWFTQNGTVMHMRGQTTYSTIDPLPGHPECDPRFATGKMTMKVNFDINLTTGDGASWGTSSLALNGVDGVFVGPFVGKIHGGAFQGKSFAVGTGDLKGLFENVSMQQTGENTYEVHGIVYSR